MEDSDTVVTLTIGTKYVVQRALGTSLTRSSSFAEGSCVHRRQWCLNGHFYDCRAIGGLFACESDDVRECCRRGLFPVGADYDHLRRHSVCHPDSLHVDELKMIPRAVSIEKAGLFCRRHAGLPGSPSRKARREGLLALKTTWLR